LAYLPILNLLLKIIVLLRSWHCDKVQYAREVA